jgi:hypothetical protein
VDREAMRERVKATTDAFPGKPVPDYLLDILIGWRTDYCQRVPKLSEVYEIAERSNDRPVLVQLDSFVRALRGSEQIRGKRPRSLDWARESLAFLIPFLLDHPLSEILATHELYKLVIVTALTAERMEHEGFLFANARTKAIDALLRDFNGGVPVQVFLGRLKALKGLGVFVPGRLYEIVERLVA